MPAMRGRKKSTVTPPCYSQLAVIAEDGEVSKQGSLRVTDNIIEEDGGKESHLGQVMETANKLNLKTRRASTNAWRAQYVDRPTLPQMNPDQGPERDGKLTEERKQRINQALEWIKSELIDLRRQDQSLAKQLLGIRQDISRLRLSRSCEEHEDMLEDAQIGMEEFSELSKVLDMPYEEPLSPSPLKHLGVTKMNISLRRFSTC